MVGLLQMLSLFLGMVVGIVTLQDGRVPRVVTVLLAMSMVRVL